MNFTFLPSSSFLPPASSSMETSRQRGVADDLTAASLTERARRKASLKRGGGKGEARERSAFFDDVPFIVEFSYAGRVRCGLFPSVSFPLRAISIFGDQTNFPYG